MNKKINIRSLVGHSQVDTACKCLSSLLKFCRDDIAFILHDDGTLTSQDKETFARVLDEPQFVNRAMADEKVLNLLRDFPDCTKFRKRSVLALKLFDITFFQSELNENAPLLYIDSDILFVRPFHFPKDLQKEMFVAMQDDENAYSVRPWHLKPLGKTQLLHRANSGILHTFASNLDLNRLETFFVDSALRRSSKNREYFAEQTCWAALGAKLQAHFISTNQLSIVAADAPAISSQQVALHFVSSRRFMLDNYISQIPDDAEKREPVTLDLQKAPLTSPLDLALTEGGRASRRVLQKLKR